MAEPKGAASKTTDHQAIQAWVSEHNGSPARVRGTGDENDPGILRIDFPGGAGEETLEHVSWDEWFDKFEQNDLAFLYQEKNKVEKDQPSSSW